MALLNASLRTELRSVFAALPHPVTSHCGISPLRSTCRCS